MQHTFTVGHIFCGIGGKALGAAAAVAAFGDATARFETVGGIDVDPLACRDFEALTGAPALCADVHELQPADLRRFFGRRAPDLIMMSPPCKGFSGLLSAKLAATERYQRMNTLMERALFLMCSTWKVGPKLAFVENVPRIQSRGRDTIRRCVEMGRAHGYSIAEGTHDCGELGGLAQHRRRYFHLWRHRGQLPQVVYEPGKLRVRACGEVLGPLPMPGDTVAGGPMHKVPNLSWRNWVRLALIPAGGDWRDLPGALADGEQRREKFRRAPVTSWQAPAETVTGPGGSQAANVADQRFGHVDRVTPWDEPAGTVTRSPAPSSGGGAVADPRDWFSNVLRVGEWSEPSGVVTGAARVSGGAIAVADPRLADQLKLGDNPGRHWNKFAVVGWDDPAHTVTGTDTRVGSGAPSVADPRWGVAEPVTGESPPCEPGCWCHGPLANALDLGENDARHKNKFGVRGWDQSAHTVTSTTNPGGGAMSVADPRWGGGRLGVTPWSTPSGTVAGESLPNNGRFSVADPRPPWQHVAGVTPWTEPAPVVTGGAKIHAGAFQVADPRVQEWLSRAEVLDWLAFGKTMRAGLYGVLSWQEASDTIAGNFTIDNGRAAVADPRLDPNRPPPFTPIIVAADGTWHRPLTTLELAALQGFPTTIDGKPLVLAGNSHTRWRERIGNAVPPPAARAIGEQLLRALLIAKLGAFALGSTPVWVAPSARAVVA